MEQLNIKVIIGSTREHRFSDKPANWIFDLVKQKEGVTAELIDLRDWPLPFYNEALPPKVLNGNYSEPLAKRWAEKIAEGDGYIVATAEYNHGYPAVLKNAFDWIFYPWNNKPIGFVSWGSVNGARAVEQLRLVAVELEMAPIRNAVHIKDYAALLDESGNLKEGAFDPLDETADAFLEQLLWWARALKEARAESLPPS